MDVPYSGLLKDLDEIMYVQKEVVCVLENSSSLSSLSQKEYEYILSDGGKMVGVFAD